MTGKFVQFGKPLLIGLLLTISLQGSGLWRGISFVSQSAIMETGLQDARTPVRKTPDSIEATLKNAPDFDYRFSIKDLDGNRLSFEQFKGKVIFLNLWATWCGPCRIEMPAIQELFSDIEKDKIMFVMLSIDKDSDKEKIVRYIKTNGFTFPVYQPTGTLTKQLRVPTIPTTFVVSKDGKIVTKEVGTTDFNTVKFKKFMGELAAK